MVLMLGAGMISPILPLYAAEFGVSFVGAGALVSAFAMGRFIFDYIGGTLVDRIAPRWIAFGGAALTAVAALQSGLAQSFPMLILYRTLEGVGSALYVTTAMAFITRTVEPSHMGRAMSFYQSMLLLGVSLGPAVGGFIAHNAGLRAPFFAYAALSAIVVATAGTLVADVPAAPQGRVPRGADRVTQVLRDRTVVFALVLTALIFATRAGFRLNLIPLFAHVVVDLNAFWIGVILAVAAFANFLVLWHAGSLIDRHGRRRVVLPALVVAVVIFAMFPWARTFWLLTGVAALLGAVFGYLAPAPAAVIADVTPARLSGRVMGLYRMAADLGLLVGPVAFGFLAGDFGFNTAFGLAAVLAGGVFFLGLGTRETLRRTPTPIARPG